MADDERSEAEEAAEHDELRVARLLRQVRDRVERRGRWVSLAVFIVGVVLIAVGLSLLILPGPGLLVLGAGLAGLAVSVSRLERVVLGMARWSGRSRVYLRRLLRRVPRPLLLLTGTVAVAAAAILGMELLF